MDYKCRGDCFEQARRGDKICGINCKCKWALCPNCHMTEPQWILDRNSGYCKICATYLYSKNKLPGHPYVDPD